MVRSFPRWYESGQLDPTLWGGSASCIISCKGEVKLKRWNITVKMRYSALHTREKQNPRASSENSNARDIIQHLIFDAMHNIHNTVFDPKTSPNIARAAKHGTSPVHLLGLSCGRAFSDPYLIYLWNALPLPLSNQPPGLGRPGLTYDPGSAHRPKVRSLTGAAGEGGPNLEFRRLRTSRNLPWDEMMRTE